MHRTTARFRNYVLLVLFSVPALLLAGAVRADQEEPRRLQVFQLLPFVEKPADATRLAAQLGLQQLGSSPTAVEDSLLFGDAAGHVRMMFGDGSVRLFPVLDPAAPPPPPRGQALRQAWAFANKLGLMMPGQPALHVGELTTLSNQGGTMSSGRSGAERASDRRGERHDVLYNIQLVRQIDGLDVFGPTSQLSFDVGAGGVIGASISLRPIDPKGTSMDVISRDEALRQFLQEFPYPVTVSGDDGQGDSNNGRSGAAPGTSGAAAADQVTGRLVSTQLIYFEQGMKYLQPAFLFRVITQSPDGMTAGHTWLVPAVRNTPEPIVNQIVPREERPILASPELINPLPFCVRPQTIKYGRYLLRNDSNGWLVDTQGFGANIDSRNALLRLVVPSTPPVDNAQYYWNYPWLWEPTGSPTTDYSPSFPGSVNVALIEGHGGQWIISTLSNCCDVIDLPKISGFGGYHSPAELTDYVIWQSCDVVPAPGDPYGFNFQSPASPFDVWFGMFQGMRGTYGYRTTMNIWNGVGAAFGGDLGIGAANLSAWFTECNNNVFHHGGGWNYGSAVLISGHEGDTLYDTCPLPPPGSLTIWWQHP